MSHGSIPYPRLTARYAALAKKYSAARLAEAEGASALDLAAEFNEAGEAFESFATRQSFFPDNPRRDKEKSEKSDARTYGWAMKMKAVEQVEVAGDLSLSFRYVEREVVPTRTKPDLPFAHPDGAHVRVDLILANVSSGRPIIGELKIEGDKDPFTGLVQALAGAAQLRSSAQRKRLCDQLPLGHRLASAMVEPALDVYVLLGDFPPTGRHRFQQLRVAVEIARQLEAGSLCDGLGRIRVLFLEGGEMISATTEIPERD